jgi:hypothetical protein
MLFSPRSPCGSRISHQIQGNFLQSLPAARVIQQYASWRTVISYRVTLDVPVQLLLKISDLLKKHRAEVGTRNGTRALTCWQQAKFILAWFRDKPNLRRLGEGFGIGQSTAHRYKDEGVEVLAREAPSLEETLEKPPSREFPTSSWTGRWSRPNAPGFRPRWLESGSCFRDAG